MCVLMSATAPNSCKLAVYEGEVLWKKHHVFDFHTIWGKKKAQEGSDRSDVVLGVKTHWRDVGQVCVRFGLGDLNSNAPSISYN